MTVSMLNQFGFNFPVTNVKKKDVINVRYGRIIYATSYLNFGFPVNRFFGGPKTSKFL